jgi:hypothetical protein
MKNKIENIAIIAICVITSNFLRKLSSGKEILSSETKVRNIRVDEECFD